MGLTHVVLDFDGTSTLVEAAHERYLARYRELLVAGVKDAKGDAIGRDFAARWDEGVDAVTAASPEAGWVTQSRTPAAPAAADPFILSGEVVAWLERRWLEVHPGRAVVVPPDAYKTAYADAEAPFRPELIEVLQAIVDQDVAVAFVSNSSEAAIAGRLDRHLRDHPALRARIRVFGGAAKFMIRELDWDEELPRSVTRPFRKLPVTWSTRRLARPIYLRRGAYYRTLLRVWGDDPGLARTTLVVGDIFELDLALPAALGAHVHLVERAAPCSTYDYERALTRKAGGKISLDLTRLPRRVGKLR